MTFDANDDALGLSGIPEDDRSAALTALIISAADDNKAEPTLGRIYQDIAKLGLSRQLDPLDVIPALIRIEDTAARDILALTGECSSAKEVVVAVQESIERITAVIQDDAEEIELDKADQRSPAGQLGVLISLYASSIPRIKLRNKSASATISPLLKDLEDTMRMLPLQIVPDEGRALIEITCSAVEAVYRWVLSMDIPSEDLLKCKNILHSVLQSTIIACIPFINASLAQEAFSLSSPKIASRIPIKSGREESKSAVTSAMRITKLLGFDIPSVFSNENLVPLVYFAHSPTMLPLSSPQLATLSPLIMMSITANVALDETLAILFRQLAGSGEVPIEVLASLFNVVPPLASAHPDPSIRMMAFRLLAMLLARSPQPIHLEILRELTSESEFPQMRSAAIGLVKEAVLEGLVQPNGQNIFASPQFMTTFAPILFKQNPPDLLSLGLSPEKFLETAEPSRISESLNLLYVLLLRDKDNRTGIRDRNALNSIEVDLLSPLRSFLANPIAADHKGEGHNHNDMSFLSLETNLQRVYSILPTLK
ncbi:hypothetical protein HWV62_14488 [Athelia sp. TMB]|nr:hypothetical protein HWV62_14488 [Athelia sp. TMB]